MKKSILLVLLMIFIIIGCKDNSTSPTSTDVIMPLKIGNQWVYKISYYDTLGNLTQTSYDTMTVTKDTLINSERFFLTYYSAEDVFLYYTNRADGLYSCDPHSIPINFVLEYKYPAQKGDSYYHGNRWVDSINVRIQTQVGNFNCYKYANSFEDAILPSEYLSPNVGIVYINDLVFGGIYHKAYKSELISTRLYVNE